MKWKRFGRKRSCSYFNVLSGIRLEGRTKIMKNLSQDSRSPGRDLKPGSPEYEAGVLTTRLRRSVPHYEMSAVFPFIFKNSFLIYLFFYFTSHLSMFSPCLISEIKFPRCVQLLTCSIVSLVITTSVLLTLFT
jgi:hypothetical protein